MKKYKKIAALVLAGAVTATVCGGCGTSGQRADNDVEEITVLSVWQGDSVREPNDPDNNMVQQKILEATGVKVNFQYNNVSEIERLNTMFASGEFPDLVSAPMWGMDDATTGILKKAAAEEMIMPLNDLIEQYGENIKPSLTEGLAEDFIQYDLEDEDFGGEHYFIPANVTPLEQQTTVNLSGLFIREDILNAIDYDIANLKTSEDLYEMMQIINKGNFKDANGDNIIVGGLMHSGNGIGEYTKTYTDVEGGFTGLYIKDDGSVCDDFYNPLLDEQTLYLRKLFSQGLLDIEGLSQTSARAQEKIANGKYALVPGKYTDIYGYCKDSLYKTNPEMKYVALPPLLNANGNTNTYKLEGTGGCAVLFIPRDCEKAEAVMKVLNYLYTEEGYLLTNFGIEGVSYQINADGQAEFIGDYADMDLSDRYKEGIGTYSRLVGLQYGKQYVKSEMVSPDQEAVQNTLATDYVYKNGIRISYLELANPKVDDIRAIKSNSRMNEIKQKAYCAASDEEALGYLNEMRQQVLDAGIEDLWKSVEEQMAANPDTEYLY